MLFNAKAKAWKDLETNIEKLKAALSDPANDPSKEEFAHKSQLEEYKKTLEIYRKTNSDCGEVVSGIEKVEEIFIKECWRFFNEAVLQKEALEDGGKATTQKEIDLMNNWIVAMHRVVTQPASENTQAFGVASDNLKHNFAGNVRWEKFINYIEAHKAAIIILTAILAIAAVVTVACIMLPAAAPLAATGGMVAGATTNTAVNIASAQVAVASHAAGAAAMNAAAAAPVAVTIVPSTPEVVANTCVGCLAMLSCCFKCCGVLCAPFASL